MKRPHWTVRPVGLLLALLVCFAMISGCVEPEPAPVPEPVLDEDPGWFVTGPDGQAIDVPLMPMVHLLIGR